jgi:hypothetical protein
MSIFKHFFLAVEASKTHMAQFDKSTPDHKAFDFTGLFDFWFIIRISLLKRLATVGLLEGLYILSWKCKEKGVIPTN